MSATVPVPVPQSRARELPAVARVMTLSAGCALASGLLSAAAGKIVAALAGPAAIGLLAALQQLQETALNAATANAQTAVVQGASSLEGVLRREFLRTAALIFSVAGALVAGWLLCAPARAARWAGLTGLDAPLVRGVAIAVLLGGLYVFLGALLNALGAAQKLAWLQLASPAAMALAAWPVARSAEIPAAREGAWGLLLAGAAGVAALCGALALYPYRGRLAAWFRGPGRLASWAAARRLLAISGAMLATSLAGSAALLAVRAHILRSEGLARAGLFGAAWNISMNQVSLVLASLQTHYLPTLARLSGASAGERRVAIARVLTLAAPAAAVIIAALAVSKHFWLSLFYSARFTPASSYLRWTLAGDYLKVAGWIFSIPMLASADLRAFLISDLAATAVFLAAAFSLTPWRTAAEAAAIAFLLMHAVHLAIGAAYVRRRDGFGLLSPASGVWLAGLAVVVGVSLWQWND